LESLTERAAWRQVRELRRRAAAAGIGADEVEEARDGDDPKVSVITRTSHCTSLWEGWAIALTNLDDPKTALIALIVSHHRGEAERRRKVRCGVRQLNRRLNCPLECQLKCLLV
jgi:hypothetical protein